jgi:hypothetical protein
MNIEDLVEEPASENKAEDDIEHPYVIAIVNHKHKIKGFWTGEGDYTNPEWASRRIRALRFKNKKSAEIAKRLMRSLMSDRVASARIFLTKAQKDI